MNEKQKGEGVVSRKILRKPPQQAVIFREDEVFDQNFGSESEPDENQNQLIDIKLDLWDVAGN